MRRKSRIGSFESIELREDSGVESIIVQPAVFHPHSIAVRILLASAHTATALQIS
jgi:hypothetical protein